MVPRNIRIPIQHGTPQCAHGVLLRRVPEQNQQVLVIHGGIAALRSNLTAGRLSGGGSKACSTAETLSRQQNGTGVGAPSCFRSFLFEEPHTAVPHPKNYSSEKTKKKKRAGNRMDSPMAEVQEEKQGKNER